MKNVKKIFAAALALTSVLAFFAGCGNQKDEGSVYYLSFKPEADSAWQELATKYTEETGVEVKIVTAASGTYDDVLTVEMDKEDAPTLFQCGNTGALKLWGEFCYDLSDTDFYKEMTSDEYNLFSENGEVLAAGYCYEAFGIIVNKKLLVEAGYELTDIYDFESLKAVADDIHERANELGFDAFSSAGLDSSSSWRFSGHLANMPLYYEFRDAGVISQPAMITGAYLDAYKNIWDLYITDSSVTGAALATATGDMSTGEFKAGKAVFYQNGSWEYPNLMEAGFADEDLAMLPIYCGVEGEEAAGLCCGTENCWAVNKNASTADIQATLDFMKWVVTSEEGTAMMAEQFGICPFKNAKTPTNPFLIQADEYLNEGRYTVGWVFSYTPTVDEWRAGVVDALTKYTAGTGGWSGVETAFVEGWAQQYAAENAG